MNLDGGNEPRQSVDDDFRQVIARKKNAPDERGRSRVRLLLTSVRLSSAVDLMESSGASLLTACLCLVLAGVSLFLIHKYYPHADVSADVAASNQWEPLQPQASSLEEVGDQTEGNVLPGSLLQYGPSGSTEAFIIRVGSFRIASNAKRVAESLQQNSFEVRTAVRGDGLNVVTLGPFSRKGAAEDAARRVRETVGLVPLILRSNFQ